VAELATVAVFPPYYLLENLAVRRDGSILVTTAFQHELWYIPPADAAVPVEPVLLHTFAQPASGIVETDPEVFHISTSAGQATHQSHLHRVDLRQWKPGERVAAETVLEFGDPPVGLNGSCLLAPGVILLADSAAGLIWRVDLAAGGGRATPRVWLKDASMDRDPDSPLVPPPPGVNGVRFAARTGYLYYTSTARQLFMRVPVDPDTHDPAGLPQLVAGGVMADGFCLDEDAGVAYLTTHRQNTVERVPLPPRGGMARQAVAGEPFDEQLVGPSSAAWGRRPGDYGRIAYLTTDGGVIAPPTDDLVRPARLLRAELPRPATP
jgi:sugar lactone lactonase YvrE